LAALESGLEYDLERAGMKNGLPIMVVCFLGMMATFVGGFLGGRWTDNNPPPLVLTDDARRASYLMPQKDSPAWKEWVSKYGDTADSWELFSIGFHTRYLSELSQRITKLEKVNDTNEPNAPARTN
jgi:hypothetical protein